MGVLWSEVEMLLDAGTGLEEAGGLAAGRTAAEVHAGADGSEAGAGDAEVKDAGLGISLGHQALRIAGDAPPGDEADGDEQGGGEAGDQP